MSREEEIRKRLESVRARITSAAERSGRNPDAITLIAVTKYTGVDDIRLLRDLGVRHFGENRVEAAAPKIEALAGLDAVWHMIGNIQRRKTKDVLRLFDKIDAVDRLALAEAIQNRCVELDRRAEVLVEVNVSGEAQKHGFAPEALAESLDAMAELDRLAVRGLMTMAPYGAPPDRIRAIFGALADLAARFGLPELSMGMSDDFELGIEAGATEIRVGSALFPED